ncbi:MAG TPA: NADH-quinone oxidoreductase subunit A [Roseiflexaceae bacterium]|nr:NADH-quinone oxidoreductase subunit A [Roseiflexaceae bacterium]
MLAEYAFIGLFLVAAAIFPMIPLVAARILRPSRPTPIKLDTYECGLEAIGDLRGQFKVQYYLFALAFVIFDVEAIFLFPWAVAFNQLGLFALVEMAIFVLILGFGLVYAWKKGALTWV